MSVTFQVITSLLKDGSSLLGTQRLAIRIANESIVSGSLLTVEGNEFCVLKSRGAILNVFETGQHTVTTPDKLLLGSLVQAAFGGSSPWVYEVIYVNRAKLLISVQDNVCTAEMACFRYNVEAFIHVNSPQGALALVQHMPFSGSVIDLKEIFAYVRPVISQAVNRVTQATPLTQISQRVAEIRELVGTELTAFLGALGITLSDLKLILYPHVLAETDIPIRELLNLQSALGLTSEQTLRYHIAFKMMEKGLITAPNAAAGAPFSLSAQSQIGLESLIGTLQPPTTK
jgi:hypothetical protein